MTHSVVPERPLRIILVDDAADLRALVRLRLEAAGGFDVVGEGATGHDAITLTDQRHPDLVLLDVSMPDMDGLEAIGGVLRARPEARVVMFSGFEPAGLAERARTCGAADFIEKSLPIGELPDRLRRAVSRPSLPPSPPEPATTPVDRAMVSEHLERFRAAFDGATIGMATLTLAGRVVRANTALAQLLHADEAGLVGQLFAGLVDPRSRGDVAAAVERAIELPRALSLVHRIANGEAEVWARSTVSAVRDSSRRPLYLFLQVLDITPEHETSRALFSSEQRFRILVESVADYAIFMLDVDGNIVSWNTGAKKLKGYTAEEILGRNFRIFYTPDAQARDHPAQELEIARAEGRYEEEGWRVRKDGSHFWANVVITALHDERGELIGFGKVTRDVTERHTIAEERERAAAELARANDRLARVAEEKAEFVAVTAHELRTPVQIMRGSTETLLDDWDRLDTDSRKRLLRLLAQGGERLHRLVEDLLIVGRLEGGRFEIVTETVALLPVLLEAAHDVVGGDPRVEIMCDDDIAVTADRGRLLQILTNLLSNAIRHGAAPVTVTVTVTADRDTVELCVCDHGPGVTDVDVEKLFTKFARVGSSARGTGLGLFIVRELAIAHGGDVRYEPRPGGGACFVVHLPAASPKQPRSINGRAPRGGIGSAVGSGGVPRA